MVFLSDQHILHMSEEQLRAELDAVYASTSWKITAPLRYVSLVLGNAGLKAVMRFLKPRNKMDKTVVEELLVVVEPEPEDHLSLQARRISRELHHLIQPNK